jgi:anti-sigma regulatory factor (Ser/Thr protein kinase)
MTLAILSVEIRQERDTVNARQRARQISRLLGFEPQDQTRISTAVKPAWGLGSSGPGD